MLDAIDALEPSHNRIQIDWIEARPLETAKTRELVAS